jgi:hypothetical protein
VVWFVHDELHFFSPGGLDGSNGSGGSGGGSASITLQLDSLDADDWDEVIIDEGPASGGLGMDENGNLVIRGGAGKGWLGKFLGKKNRNLKNSPSC